MSALGRRHILLILVLSALVASLEACGNGVSPEGAASPAEAVEEFAAVAGAPRASRQLGDACQLIGPALRLGYSRAGSCARILPLLLFYTGETTGIPGPTAFTVEVGKTEREGKLAFVEISIDYEGTPDPSGPVTVLTVHESGRWWVASPPAFNPAYPTLFTSLNARTREDSDRETLLTLYEQELESSGKAKDERAAEKEAQTVIGTAVDPCRSAGRSSARDPRHDIRLSHGYELTDEQPPSADLLEVMHATEGGTACFALRFAGGVPATARTELETLPMNKRLTVRWEAGEIVGTFTGLEEEQSFVPVHAALEGSTLVIRLPARALGIGGSAYRWAVTLSVPSEEDSSLLIDRVPDALAVSDNAR